MFSFVSDEVFAWVVMPILIFMARTVDVSLAVTRVMLISRGAKNIAPLIGFVEAFIWIVAVGTLLKHIDSPMCYFGYAGGFATGTWVGIRIDAYMAIGTVLIRTIINADPQDLVNELFARNFGVTTIKGQGYTGDAYLLLSIVQRKDVPEVADIIKSHFPNAFYSTEDVRIASSKVMQRG